MRITCPNCGAQYEVPDEVIPQDGRDVQCSNCGMTWFQAHPDHPQDQPKASDPPAEPVESDTAPSPPPDDESHSDYEDSGAQRRELDADVTDILRQEAEHEAELRAAEANSGLESQPDLGLDAPSPDSSSRGAAAAERLAKLRGEAAEANVEPESRRNLLPDIEVINSSLQPDESSTALTSSLAAEEAETQKSSGKGGFSRGFALTLVLAALVVVIYVNAPQIAAKFPQVDPYLNTLVSLIDQVRTWLDEQVRAFTN